MGSNPTLARTNNYPDAVKQHYDNASKYTQGVFEAKGLGNKSFKVDFKDKKSKGWSGDVTTVKEVKSRADIHFLGPFVADDKINDLAKFQIKKPGKFKLTLEFWLFKFWKDRAKTESHFSPYINGKTFANYTHKHGQPLSNAPGCKIVQKDVAFWNSGLAGTLVRCSYKGEYLTNKRLVVNGYDVTADNSKTPTSHQFSVKDNSRQPKGTQAWAIKSFEVSFDGMKAAESSDKSKSKKVKHAFEWEVPKKLRMSFVLPKVPPGHPLATVDDPQAVTTPHVPHTGQPAQSYPSRERMRDAYGYGQHLGHEMSHVKQRRRGDSQQWPPGQAPYASYPGPQKFDASSPVAGWASALYR